MSCQVPKSLVTMEAAGRVHSHSAQRFPGCRVEKECDSWTEVVDRRSQQSSGPHLLPLGSQLGFFRNQVIKFSPRMGN